MNYLSWRSWTCGSLCMIQDELVVDAEKGDTWWWPTDNRQPLQNITQAWKKCSGHMLCHPICHQLVCIQAKTRCTPHTACNTIYGSMVHFFVVKLLFRWIITHLAPMGWGRGVPGSWVCVSESIPACYMHELAPLSPRPTWAHNIPRS